MATSYIPGRGNLVWLQFTPQAGHELGGTSSGAGDSSRYLQQTRGFSVVLSNYLSGEGLSLRSLLAERP
jgi:hypothetical protein